MTESLPLMMSLACTQLRMRVEEAWLAVTRVAADSLEPPRRRPPGARLPRRPRPLGLRRLPPRPVPRGVNHVRTVLCGGEVAYEA